MQVIQKKPEERTENEKLVLQLILSNVQEFTTSRQASEFFSKMGDKEFWQNLSDCLEYVFVPRGEPLFHFGDPGDRMYILLKGEAVLYFKKKAEELIEDEKRRKTAKKAENLLKPRDWNEFVKAVDHQLVHDYSEEILEAVTQGITHPYELYLLNTNKLDVYCDKDIMRFKKQLIFKSGSIFGEVALKQNQQRLGTIMISEDSHMAFLRKDKFDYFFSGKAIQDKKNKEFLKTIFHLPHDIMERIPFYFTQVSCMIKEVIYKQDSPIQFIYIIKTGQVEVGHPQQLYRTFESPASDLGKNAISLHKKKSLMICCPIAIMTENSMFGHRDIVESSVYQTSARVISENALLLRIAAKDFKKLFEETYSFRQFIQALSKKSYRDFKQAVRTKEKASVHLQRAQKECKSNISDLALATSAELESKANASTQD